jgi:hypothetical protein
MHSLLGVLSLMVAPLQDEHPFIPVMWNPGAEHWPADVILSMERSRAAELFETSLRAASGDPKNGTAWRQVIACS